MAIAGAAGSGSCARVAVVALTLSGCVHSEMERHFFEQNRSPRSRVQSILAYTPKEQYKIFRYGHREVHPPPLYLARAAAENSPELTSIALAGLKSAANEEEVFANIQLLRWGSYCESRIDPIPSVLTACGAVSARRHCQWIAARMAARVRDRCLSRQ